MINKERLTAFSDAIIAIVITVLLLEMPKPHGFTITALFDEWKVILIYIGLFLQIMVVWYNHHLLFNSSKKFNRNTYWINTFWLLFLTMIPYMASWMADYPGHAVPGIMYIIVNIGWAASFQILGLNLAKINTDLVIPNKNAFYYLYVTYLLSILVFLFNPELAILMVVIFQLIVVTRSDNR